MVRIVAISDVHMQHDKLELPDGDILVIAGDVCTSGTKGQLRRFMYWLWWQAPRYKHVVFVAGNHERCIQDMGTEKTRKMLSDIKNLHYLKDEWVVLEGLIFYGSPWTKKWFEWAYMLETPEELAAKWAMIPDKVDVLVTHSPPWGILDANARGVMCGCPRLLERVYQVKPQLHIFGHIHPEGGKEHLENGTIFKNAAVCNDRHWLTNPITVVDLEVE